MTQNNYKKATWVSIINYYFAIGRNLKSEIHLQKKTLHDLTTPTSILYYLPAKLSFIPEINNERLLPLLGFPMKSSPNGPTLLFICT